MVELRSLLDIDNVWLSGAVFSQGDNSNTALVKSEESKIKIYVRCSNHLYSPNTYLNIIKNTLLRINESLGLIAEGFIVYKKDDCEEMFNYDYLVESYNHGNKEIYSSVFKKNLKITDILNQSDRDVNEMNNNLLVEVINACRILQSNKKYWEASENERNTYIRDLLRAKGYIISDQTLSGKSSTGKQEGELDLEIFKAPDLPWTIIEALNLKGFSLSDIEYYNNHLIKLIDNYNPSGLQFLFLISYLNCSKEKTKDIWLKHTNHLNEYSPKNFVLQNAKQLNTENSFINGIECTYDCNGLPFTVYHICVRLGE